MWILTRRTLKEFAAEHADATTPLDDWFRIAKHASWHSIVDLRVVYPHADFIAPFTIFNIKGNAYRLMVKILYAKQRIYIIEVLTHAEYSKGTGK